MCNMYVRVASWAVGVAALLRTLCVTTHPQEPDNNALAGSGKAVEDHRRTPGSTKGELMRQFRWVAPDRTIIV